MSLAGGGGRGGETGQDEEASIARVSLPPGLGLFVFGALPECAVVVVVFGAGYMNERNGKGEQS